LRDRLPLLWKLVPYGGTIFIRTDMPFACRGDSRVPLSELGTIQHLHGRHRLASDRYAPVHYHNPICEFEPHIKSNGPDQIQQLNTCRPMCDDYTVGGHDENNYCETIPWNFPLHRRPAA